MKTVEEFIKEIADSKELQEELNTMSEEVLGEFLKKHGCDATAKEFTDFARSQEGEIGDDAASAAVGGLWIRKIYSSAAPFGSKR